MPFKEFTLDQRLTITIYKRKANRSLRLSVAPSGEVRVSIPTWAPYSAGVAFARSRQAWIIAQKPPTNTLQEGQPIGKAHHLHFEIDNRLEKPGGRLRATEAVVKIPASLHIEDPLVQQAARSVSIKALRTQAEALLPQRLAFLAAEYKFRYRSVSVKQLKSRWGSCDSKKNIVLNLFLMRLPWDCIDYVLLHELTHTEFLEHGPNFWAALEKTCPQMKAIRKILRTYQPVL
jgi:predicted metal-dependent hydrolase